MISYPCRSSLGFMQKHGAELHFVRPDAVYSTSVLQPIPGYQPVSNAYEVATRFTAPQQFGADLNGLGQADGLTWWQKLRFRFAAAAHRRRAENMHRFLARLSHVAPAAPQTPAPPVFLPLSPIGPGHGGHGTKPALENMARVATQITAGIVRSGEDALPPGVAVAPQTRMAADVAPDYSAVPAMLASLIQAGIPFDIAEKAVAAAVESWQAARSW